LTATTIAFIPTRVIKAWNQKWKEEGRARKSEIVETYHEARKEMKEILTWESVRGEDMQ
jgi:hypothetical protein